MREEGVGVEAGSEPLVPDYTIIFCSSVVLVFLLDINHHYTHDEARQEKEQKQRAANLFHDMYGWQRKLRICIYIAINNTIAKQYSQDEIDTNKATF